MAHESQCPISEHESFDLQTVIEQAGIFPPCSWRFLLTLPLQRQ